MLSTSEPPWKKSSNDTQATLTPTKLIVIFLLWILALFLALSFLRNHDPLWKSSEPSRSSISKPDNICKSPECINLAHQLHNWQDISVDPCQDFYKAACGKYNEHTTVGNPRWVKKGILVRQLVKEYLDKNIPTTSKSENVIQLYYQKCKQQKNLNATEIKEERMREIFRLSKTIGSWPMLDKNWTDMEFDLNDMMSNMAKLGTTNFGFFVVKPSEANYLKISLHDALFSFKQFSEVYGAEKYNEFFQELMKVNNVTIDEDVKNEDRKQVETFLNVMFEHTKVEPGSYILEIDDLKKQVPSIDFKRIFKNFFDPKRKDVVWKQIKDKIYARNHSYFGNGTQSLEAILKTAPKRGIANFLMNMFIFSEARKIAFEEKYKEQFRNKCAEKVIQTFPLASLRIFVRNHFDKENLEIASEMVEDFRRTFIETIEKSTWLDTSTKIRAIRKMEMMKKKIGYPKELDVPGALDSFFDSLDLSPDDSYYKLENKVSIFKFRQKMDIIASELPIKSEETYLDANAFYEPGLNILNINVPILGDLMFDSTYPEYARIASIGGVIGHEMGHAFDTRGIKLDENGKENNWWTPEDFSEYNERAQCLVDQYSNYDDPDFGRNLNGTTTIREIVADIFAVDSSWKIYKKMDISNQQKIVGFEDYHTDKLFYRMVALNWCSSRDHTSLDEQLTRVHPTFNFRVNGIFSNMKSFAEAYNCPVGSPMNPEKKCELF